MCLDVVLTSCLWSQFGTGLKRSLTVLQARRTMSSDLRGEPEREALMGAAGGLVSLRRDGGSPRPSRTLQRRAGEWQRLTEY